VTRTFRGSSVSVPLEALGLLSCIAEAQ
jgi:hypothetical protein